MTAGNNLAFDASGAVPSVEFALAESPAERLLADLEIAGAHFPDYQRALDIIGKAQEADNSTATAGDLFRNLLDWLGTPTATRYFGRAFSRRLIALAWCANPAAFDGKSLAALANERRITRQALAKYAAHASRVFGLRNRAQRSHGARFEKPSNAGVDVPLIGE